MKKKKCTEIRQISITLGVIAGVYLTFKFLFPLVAPFLLAYLLVVTLGPLIDKIREKVPVHKGLLAGILILILVFLIGILGYILCELAVKELKQLFANWQIYRVWGESYVNQCCCNLEGFFNMKSGTLTTYVQEELPNWFGKLKAKALPSLMQSSFSYMKQTIALVSALFVGIVAAILMLSDYVTLHKSIRKMPFYKNCRLVKNRMLKACLVFLRAQFIIMAIIGAVCSATLLCMGNPYGLLIGITIGVLDALPLLGTGVVLVPWGIFALIQGNIVQGIVLLVLYAATSLIREFLEPKLMGSQIGLPPVLFLASVYWGLYLFGIWGVVLGPIGTILVVEIVKCVFCGENLDKEENMA